MRYLMIFIIMMLAGCASESVDTGKETMLDQPVQISTYVVQDDIPVEEHSEDGKERFYTARLFASGIEPDTITVEHGDKVNIYITNVGDDFSTIGVSGFVEEYVHEGNTVLLSFVADKRGEFFFGDERSSTRKGRLIVN